MLCVMKRTTAIVQRNESATSRRCSRRAPTTCARYRCASRAGVPRRAPAASGGEAARRTRLASGQLDGEAHTTQRFGYLVAVVALDLDVAVLHRATGAAEPLEL